MKCPRCQIALIATTQDHIAISKCSKCDGVWLHQEDLNTLIHFHEKNFSVDLIQKTLKLAHAGLTDAEKADTPACPQCNAPMAAMNYNYSSGIIINTCLSHHGLWLDHDELIEAEASMDYWDEQKKAHDKEWRELVDKRAPATPTSQGLNRIGSLLSGLFSKNTRL